MIMLRGIYDRYTYTSTKAQKTQGWNSASHGTFPVVYFWVNVDAQPTKEWTFRVYTLGWVPCCV